MAMVQPFLVGGEYQDDRFHGGSFVESRASSIVQVREDTPSPTPQLQPVQTRLSAPAAATGASNAASTQSRQRREISGLRSLCCGLFPRRRHHHTANSSATGSSPPRQILHPIAQRQAPSAHSTIFEEDEEELNDQENQPPPSVENRPHAIFGHQSRTLIENQPSTIFEHQTRTMIRNQAPTILEHLVDNDEHNSESRYQAQENEQDQAEQEMLDELNVRRSSVRHSWVTVSRWLE